MKLEDLLGNITYERFYGALQREVRDICYHSGKIRPGDLFVCLRGLRTDGHEYLQEVLAAGAAAVVVERDAAVPVDGDILLYTDRFGIRGTEIVEKWGATVIVVEDTRKALAELSAAFFGYPARKLRMIGITGTKGKTTTSFLLASILREAGYRVGMIGTIFMDDGKRQIPAHNTTPESCEVQRYLAAMVDNGCDCCVMEVSSQGLMMQRVHGIRYDIGMFLNLEPDHIGPGEHASFSEYLCWKSRLMQQCDIGIVNQDDPYVDQILRGHTCELETFSMRHPSDVMAEEPSFFCGGGRLQGRFVLRADVRRMELMIQLPGAFNVYNALAAASAAMHFRVDEGALRRGLAEASVPGRCENVSTDEDYVLLIDYAHNEMSLKKLLETLRGFQPGRLIVLFGCGGSRSGLRRGRMGETAGHLADLTILTSDNPRWEEPERILDEIEDGIRGTGGSYVRIADRREAVRYAVRHARRGDIIVLAGKGHEDYQEIRGKRYPMSDHRLAAEAQEEIHSEHDMQETIHRTGAGETGEIRRMTPDEVHVQACGLKREKRTKSEG